jgi:hypothetical protein
MTEAASAARGGGDGPPTARADGARDQPEEDPLQCWTTERDRIYEQVTSRGWNAQSRVERAVAGVRAALPHGRPRLRPAPDAWGGFIAPRIPLWTATLDAMDADLVTYANHVGLYS